MICLTKKELADAAGYTYRRLYDIDKGLPDGKKLFVLGYGGKYELPTFVQRWVEYNVEKEAGEDDDLDTVKARHEAVKMQKSELELMRMRGDLVDIEEIRALWCSIATTVMQKLMHIPSKLASALVMIGSAESIEGIIDKEIHDALTMIADTPLPDMNAERSRSPISDDDE